MRLAFQTEEVLAVLNENRAKHKDTYEKALVGYKQSLVEAADHFAALARQYQAGEIDGDALDQARNKAAYVQRPSHYVDSYDQAISMLQSSKTETVELDEKDYARYYNDNWEWRQQFVAASSSYIGE